MTTPAQQTKARTVVFPPAPTKSLNPHPADGMCIHVPVEDGSAFMDIIDPRSFENGGAEWVMRYGNPEAIRFTVAMLLSSYDYLLSDNLTAKEAQSRLRTMRAYRHAARTNPQTPGATGSDV